MQCCSAVWTTSRKQQLKTPLWINSELWINGGRRGLDCFALWSYRIWEHCVNNFVANCSSSNSEMRVLNHINVKIRVAFFFGLQTCFVLNLVNSSILYGKWPVSNNLVKRMGSLPSVWSDLKWVSKTFPNIFQGPRKTFLTQVFNLMFSFKVWVFILFLILFLPGHASMKQALLSVLYPLHCVPSQNLALAWIPWPQVTEQGDQEFLSPSKQLSKWV